MEREEEGKGEEGREEDVEGRVRALHTSAASQASAPHTKLLILNAPISLRSEAEERGW